MLRQKGDRLPLTLCAEIYQVTVTFNFTLGLY